MSAELRRPPYDRRDLVAGIVHIGVGNFHRAHQAMAIDRLLRQGEARDFAICGVGLLPSDRRMADVLRAQDGLYVLEERHADGRRDARVIGSIIDYLFAPDDPVAVIERMADPATRIVSLTVTEGGYNTDPVTGEFLGSAPAIREDLRRPEAPTTVFGFIVEALRRRRERGLGAFTVMSCDNVPGNGRVARTAVVAFARMRDPELAAWIAEAVRFPESMVDRITPATTDELRRHVRDELGVDDEWPVSCEPHFQWVLEDTFSASRPPFDLAGVRMVDDVAPYELMKLRLLNGGHQALGFLGYLAGHRTVDAALDDPDLRAFVAGFMSEVIPTVPEVPGIDLHEYCSELLERFANPAVRDTLARLCADSSNRVPKFVVPSILDNLAAGRPVPFGAAVCAAWARYAIGRDDFGAPIDVADRCADERRAAAQREILEPGAFLADPALFGDLAERPDFVESFAATFTDLRTVGARATYGALVSPGGAA